MKQRIGWKQRLLSAVLAVAMCVAMLPAQAVAFAEDGPGPGGSSAAQPGQPASSDKSSDAAEQPSAPDGGAGAPSPGGRKRQPGTFRKFFLFRRLGL